MKKIERIRLASKILSRYKHGLKGLIFSSNEDELNEYIALLEPLCDKYLRNGLGVTIIDCDNKKQYYLAFYTHNYKKYPYLGEDEQYIILL